jgi:predicted Zn-dependent protease
VSTPQEIVERTLAASSSHGCVVLVRTRSIANLRWARSTLTTNGETLSHSVTVVAFVDVEGGVAAGSVTVNAPTLEELPAIVRRAEALAVDDGAAEDAGPLARGLDAAADWSDVAELATSARFAALAPDLGEVLDAGRHDGIEHFGYVEQAVTTTYLGTSTGLRLRHADHQARLELTAKSHARTRSTWVGRGGSTLDGVDLAAIDAELRQRLTWQENRVELAPGRHPALLSTSAVADLMIELYWSSIGRDAADGQSVWSASGGSTRVGQLVVDPRVTLSSDPRMPGFECAPFVLASGSSSSSSVFDNGLPTGATSWIGDGVLENLITTRHTAAETGLEHRPDIDNLRLEVEGSSGSLEELAARAEYGVLVTCLWYNRVVDPQTLLLTGLTRDGVYVVRGGEVVGAATNFRFNDSPVDVLRRISDAGTPVPTLAREMGDYFSRSAMPPLLVDGFNFSTVSQAS